MSTNGWNERMRESTNRLAEIVFTYKILHERCFVFNNYIDIILGISSGLTTVITGILITLPSYTPCDRVTGYEQNIYTSLIFSSAILQFVKQYLALGKESTKHFEYSKKYKILSNNIMNQILVCDNKTSAQNYIIDIATQINNNISSAPSINPVIAWYYNKYKHTDTIIIQGDYNNEKTEETDQFFSMG